MKLTVFNGSPKPGKNNTDVLINQLNAGFKSVGENQVEIIKLNKLNSMKEAAAIFAESDAVLLAFPLYCYAMPGGVKEFIESLEGLAGKCRGKKLGFLVQYGFSEAIHARPLEQYFIELSRILGGDYMGTIIKGGCDSLSSNDMPGFMKGANRAILEGIYRLGTTLGKTGRFDQEELNDFAQPEVEKKGSILLTKLFTRIANEFYWKAKLRKNGVSVRESYAKPYEEVR